MSEFTLTGTDKVWAEVNELLRGVKMDEADENFIYSLPCLEARAVAYTAKMCGMSIGSAYWANAQPD